MSAAVIAAAASAELADVTRFLVREARLLDELRLEEWLAMFADDGHYWVPASWGQQDAREQLSIYYEDVDLLRARIMRLQHPRTETMRPPPRTAHLVTNVELEPTAQPGCVEARSAFVMVDYRLREQRTFAGHYRHVLRRSAGDYRIVLKRVDVLNCDAPDGHVRMIIPF
ncbi:MAG: aromatic-ring-hydroxylating dioxygenase subunit beta [Kofleriaceae bacterium]|nr:aromatic-ring-hydroxylating dioxygenase subunit beta [Kofleriaceae bacterium]